ncbi:MAG: dihydrofolate reductase [Rhodospirillaceae bacterium]|nr:dihydrofolate reductase [Rhodospirillaceae bacterium]
MILTLVVAMSENRVIGRDGDLPWRLPNDLKHFKQVTMGHPIIMGRKTWESLYVKPLPGRRNIVVTRNAGYEAEGAETSDSLGSALTLATGEDEAMIIGGAELFAAALDTATRLHLTEVHAKIEGDTYFPEFDRSQWREVSREAHDAEGDAPAYSFLLLEKR